MLNSNENRQVTFDKVMRGYNVEDVVSFLDEMATQMETLENEKKDLEKKIYILAEKIAEYKSDENNLKTALINAQRLGESVISEAKQKAETIVKEASNRAAQIEDAAVTATENEKTNFARIQAEVAEFKNNILSFYRTHIESLSTLPEPVEPPVTENAEQQEATDDLLQQDTKVFDLDVDSSDAENQDVFSDELLNSSIEDDFLSQTQQEHSNDNSKISSIEDFFK